jgi:hypothetical protein
LALVVVLIETLGGFLELYSAWLPLKLPQEIDRQQFEDVTALVAALRDFSREHSLVFEIELEGDFVGEITHGSMDTALADCLLGEWGRRIGVSA